MFHVFIWYLHGLTLLFHAGTMSATVHKPKSTNSKPGGTTKVVPNAFALMMGTQKKHAASQLVSTPTKTLTKLLPQQKKKSPHQQEADALKRSFSDSAQGPLRKGVQNPLLHSVEKPLQQRQQKNIADNAVTAIFNLGRGYCERTKDLIRDVFNDPAIQHVLKSSDDSKEKIICTNLTEFLRRLKNKEGKSGRLTNKHEQMKRIIIFASTGFDSLPAGVLNAIADTLEVPRPTVKKLHAKLLIWEATEDLKVDALLNVTQKQRKDKRSGSNIITEMWHALCETKKGANQITRLWLPPDERTAQQRYIEHESKWYDDSVHDLYMEALKLPMYRQYVGSLSASM